MRHRYVESETSARQLGCAEVERYDEDDEGIEDMDEVAELEYFDSSADEATTAVTNPPTRIRADKPKAMPFETAVAHL